MGAPRASKGEATQREREALVAEAHQEVEVEEHLQEVAEPVEQLQVVVEEQQRKVGGEQLQLVRVGRLESLKQSGLAGLWSILVQIQEAEWAN